MAAIIDAIIRLQDRFTPNLQQIQDELEETRNISRRAARDMQSLGESISGIGTTMLPVAGAIAGGIGVATSQFADFDYVITQAGLKAGATEEQFKQMSDTVIAAGAKYPISIQAAAEAMDRLAAGGFNAEQSMASLAPVIQAAVASGEDMALVSDVVTSALSTWGLMEGDVAKNAEMVADVIQMASNKSKLGVQEIKTALQYAAAPASALGDSLQTVTAILGTMANKGIEASTAGTSLRTAYLNLTAGSKPAMDAIAALNLEVFDSEGKFKGMVAMMNQLREKMAGMSEEERTPLLRDIFGTEGISAVLAVLNTGQAEFDEMLASMNNATGSSAEAFEKMNATFKGQMEAAKGAFEAFVIRVGSAAAPMLAPLVSRFQEFVKYLNELPDEKIQEMLKLGMGFIGMTGGILALGKGISIIGSLASFLNPIGTQLARGATLSSFFASRLGAVSTSLNLIRNVGTLAIAQVLSPFRGAANLMVAPFRGAALAAQTMFNVMMSGAPVSTALMAGFNRIRLSLGLLDTGGGTVISRFIGRISGMATAVIGRIGGMLTAIRSFPGAVIRGVTGIVNAVRMIGSVQGLFTLMVNGIRAVSLAFVSNPVGIALLAIGAAALVVANNWDLFKNVAEVVWNKIQYIVGDVINGIKQNFSGLIEHAQQVFNRLVEAWNLLTGSSEESGAVLTAIVNTLGSVFTAGFAIIASAVEFAINNIFTVLNSLLTVFDGVIQFITGVFTGNWSAAWEGVKTIFTGVIDGIKGIFGNFIDFVSNALDRITGKAANAGKEVSTAQAMAEIRGEKPPGENALGTNFWRGGLTWVHEQGPEIIDLPTGTKVIPHSKSLAQEYGRGLSDGLSMAPSAFLSPGTVPGNVSNSDTAASQQESRISHGNGAGLPQSILQGGKDGQERKSPPRATDGARKAIEVFKATPQRDELGNIVGADIPEHSRITQDDTEEVKTAKRAEQEKVYMQTVPLADETARRLPTGGNPQSNIRSGEKPKPAQAVTININIPKLADALYVREKADINDITRQLVFQIRGMAMNRIQGAVR